MSISDCCTLICIKYICGSWELAIVITFNDKAFLSGTVHSLRLLCYEAFIQYVRRQQHHFYLVWFVIIKLSFPFPLHKGNAEPTDAAALAALVLIIIIHATCWNSRT